MGSVYGAVFGAIAIILLKHELSILGTKPGMPLQAPKVLSIGVYGLILTAVVLFFPRGLVPALADRLRRIPPSRALPGETERAAELEDLRGPTDAASHEAGG